MKAALQAEYEALRAREAELIAESRELPKKYPITLNGLKQVFSAEYIARDDKINAELDALESRIVSLMNNPLRQAK